MDATIKDFIQKTVEEIHSALPDGYEISDEIEFDISLITTTNKKGGVNIKIANGEINKEKQTVHSINFGVVNVKKQQETMQKNATSIISIVEQGLTAISSTAAKLNPPVKETQPIEKKKIFKRVKQ
jgi:hypothetical protein